MAYFAVLKCTEDSSLKQGLFSTTHNSQKCIHSFENMLVSKKQKRKFPVILELYSFFVRGE